MAPAWFDQLTQYREEIRLQAEAGEDPVKVKASRAMHGVLSGMANMVRSAGFQTSDLGGEDAGNMIGREESDR